VALAGSKAQHIAELLRDYHLDANRCLMVGDAMADYAGAMSNQVQFLGRVVARGDPNPFPLGTVTFTDFSMLPGRFS